MKIRLVIFALLATVAPAAPGQEATPLRVFIRAGRKTHGPGEHDYPQFLADWKKLLNERGGIADGALTFPAAEQLAKADVMIIYSGDAGYTVQQGRPHYGYKAHAAVDETHTLIRQVTLTRANVHDSMRQSAQMSGPKSSIDG